MIEIPIRKLFWVPKYKVLVSVWKNIRPYASNCTIEQSMRVVGDYHTITFEYVDQRHREAAKGDCYVALDAPDHLKEIEVWHYGHYDKRAFDALGIST
jgi:hypothetical protein